MHKSTGTLGLFSEEFRLNKISEQGDPLERLNKVIDWEFFRSVFNSNKKEKLVQSGPKAYDPLLLFKILILQRYYNLSDFQTEYQILDRLSFCRFLGLTLNDRVPDEKTIWAFRNKLIKERLEEQLFELFHHALENNGLIANEGKIIDASFVEAPRQRNSRAENKKIKEEGVAPEDWDEMPNKKCQKDIDARWTKKNNENHFGYKNHTKVDNKYKFIDTYQTTDASVHDSQVLEELLTEQDSGQELYGDSAYTGKEQEAILKSNNIKDCTHEKGYKNRPLTEDQKEQNKEKSKIRARVEHVFGFMEQSMNKLFVRSIGIERAHGFVGLVNLTYNMFRYEQVVRLQGIRMSSWQ